MGVSCYAPWREGRTKWLSKPFPWIRKEIYVLGLLATAYFLPISAATTAFLGDLWNKEVGPSSGGFKIQGHVDTAGEGCRLLEFLQKRQKMDRCVQKWEDKRTSYWGKTALKVMSSVQVGQESAHLLDSDWALWDRHYFLLGNKSLVKGLSCSEECPVGHQVSGWDSQWTSHLQTGVLTLKQYELLGAFTCEI